MLDSFSAYGLIIQTTPQPTVYRHRRRGSVEGAVGVDGHVAGYDPPSVPPVKSCSEVYTQPFSVLLSLKTLPLLYMPPQYVVP